MFGNVALVTFTMLLMQLVVAMAWALGGWALDLPRRPARHWALAGVLGAGGVALSLSRVVLPMGLVAPVGNLFTLGAVWVLARGMRIFLGTPLRDAEHGILLSACVFAALVAAVNFDAIGVPVLVIVFSLAILWIFVRATWDAWHALRQEFNPRIATALVLPLLLMCAMVALRLAGAAVGGTRALHVDTLLNVAIALIYLLNLALLHLSLAAMVVLRLMASLRKLSTRDALTGLLNRREWTAKLQAQHRWLGRFGEPYTVLMIDIDHFKQVNDTWGHPAGDAVLVATAQALGASVRALDLAGRLGGEEFAVLMPRTDASHAGAAAERLRSTLADAHITWKNEPIAVTVSIGVAIAQDADEPPESVMERADAALYDAKRAGRNAVVVAAARPEPAALARPAG